MTVHQILVRMEEPVPMESMVFHVNVHPDTEARLVKKVTSKPTSTKTGYFCHPF